VCGSGYGRLPDNGSIIFPPYLTASKAVFCWALDKNPHPCDYDYYMLPSFSTMASQPQRYPDMLDNFPAIDERRHICHLQYTTLVGFANRKNLSHVIYGRPRPQLFLFFFFFFFEGNAPPPTTADRVEQSALYIYIYMPHCQPVKCNSIGLPLFVQVPQRISPTDLSKTTQKVPADIDPAGFKLTGVNATTRTNYQIINDGDGPLEASTRAVQYSHR